MAVLYARSLLRSCDQNKMLSLGPIEEEGIYYYVHVRDRGVFCRRTSLTLPYL